MNTGHEENFKEKLELRGVSYYSPSNHYPKEMLSLHIDKAEWKTVASIACDTGFRLVSLWGAENSKYPSRIVSYMAFAPPSGFMLLVRTYLPIESPLLPSVSEHFAWAIRMERNLQDMFGIEIENSADKRCWIKHEHWPEGAHPLRSSFNRNQVMPREEGTYDFLKADGEGVYEIPVGPVHAGIIEPGHFRFHAVGEEILNLEERLGYVHKGIEGRMEGMNPAEGVKLASRVSGDSTVGHGWAFSRACEEAFPVMVPMRANYLRAILCERERVANHIGDIGSICNDAAFSFMHAQMQRLREEMAMLHKKIFGHRLLMDLVVPGGVNFDIDEKPINALRIHTTEIVKEVEELREIYIQSASIQERVTGSGIIDLKTAKSAGLLGLVARASGLFRDVRVNNPYPPYNNLKVACVRKRHGDVASRVKVRFEEIRESGRIICELLEKIPGGDTRVDLDVYPSEASSALSVIEGFRGEITYWIHFNSDGLIKRCMIQDPSTANWLGLELAVRGLPIPEFPLINKSFNCSYSGNDL